MKYLALFLLLSTILFAATCRADDHVKLDLKDGDRVAFIGNTFVEREAKDCYIETMLTSRFPDRNITFRNLGYSADTVTGSARGLCAGWSTFEGPDKAFERLRKLVAEFKPTVLLMNYGMTESFSSLEGIPTFVSNYNKMLDALSAAAGTSPRIVLISPNYHENLGRPLPDPAEHNKNLKLYSEAIEKIATERKAVFIDLFSLTKDHKPHLTSNGIHLTHFGYWEVSFIIEKVLFGEPESWTVKLDTDGAASASGIELKNVSVKADSATFSLLDKFIPHPPSPADVPDSRLLGLVEVPTIYDEAPRIIKFTGLKTLTTYALNADGGREIIEATGQVLAQGLAIPQGDSRVPKEALPQGIPHFGDPLTEQAETLRKLIVAKNFDYFNYQRPDNDSYILAFRKGEQGRNAGEIPQFLPLVAEKEKQIAELRVPKPVTYTLTAVK